MPKTANLTVIKNEEANGLPERVTLTNEELESPLSGTNKKFLKTFLDHDCQKLSNSVLLFATKEYSTFSFLDENRDVDSRKVANLKQSFRDNGYKFNPIFVNEKLNIIDGQHRFRAIVESNQVLYFFIMPGWNAKDVRTLNINLSEWKDIDFLKSYAKDKNNDQRSDYARLYRFHQIYDFNLTTTIMIVKGRGQSSVGEGKMKLRQGSLAVSTKDIDRATAFIEKLEDFINYHPKGWKSQSFVRSFSIMQMTPGYNHERMVEKLQDYPDAVLREAKTLHIKDYLTILENMYNRNLSRNSKIRCSFLGKLSELTS
ncbi:MAG: ParB/RepB/Spo0J family partition protein [Candidatus Nomurabacteria bacterium]|nr:ParB/RepB/Spo0J family partition protein [Candidatus Nomurabacteria bacterium]